MPPQKNVTSTPILALVNGLAPCSLGALLIYPQLVTPTMRLGVDSEPAVVPVSVGRFPKLISHGPPLEPPHISDPMMVLLELGALTKP